jgi:hypothetical protein
MRLADGAGFAVIRRKQTLEQILANEVDFTA